MKKAIDLFILIAGLTLSLTACQSSQPAPTEIPAANTAVPTIAPTTPPATPTLEPETAAPEAGSAGSTAVIAPPHGPVFVEDTGPQLADLAPGWTRVSPGGDTRCAHNTDYAFWVRPGTVNKLLVYFQGGGGCWDAESCAVGSTFYAPDVTEADNPTGRQGILDMNHPQNPFRDYHALYIPSCNGDIYWGNSVQQYPTTDGGTLEIYHRGFVNASAALDWAYGNILDPDAIFVTGCSAGSVGSRVHTPYIIEKYADTRVTQLGDSLAFVFGRPVRLDLIYETYNTFPDWIPALAELAHEDGLLMADYDTAIANYYPDTTFALYNTENDNVQVRFYAANGADPVGFRADLAGHLSAVHAAAPNFRSYTASGDLHCILPRSQFYTLETNGVSLVDWVTTLAGGEDVANVQCDTCMVNSGDTAVTGEPAFGILYGEWEQMGTMPTPRSENRGVVIDSHFYIPGGWGGESVFEVYDPATDTWDTLADLPDGRHHFMTTAYNDQLYLFGGSAANAYSPTNTAWVYDPASDTWTDLASMPDNRMGGAAVTVGDFIYIVGGESDNSAQPTLRYDPAADSWVELAPMHQLREHTAASVIDGRIYAVGGWWRGSGELTSMEIYDPATDTWTEAPPMKIARGGLATAVLDSQLFVAGGEILSAGRRTENRVEVYDPATGTWAFAPDLPAMIHGFPFLTFEGELWIMGGSEQAGGRLHNGRLFRYTYRRN